MTCCEDWEWRLILEEVTIGYLTSALRTWHLEGFTYQVVVPLKCSAL